MTTAICPDGIEREVDYNIDGVATVLTPGGSSVTGEVVDGKFKPHANHHGAHRMWYDKPDEGDDAGLAQDNRMVSAESVERIERHVAAGSPGIERGDFKP